MVSRLRRVPPGQVVNEPLSRREKAVVWIVYLSPAFFFSFLAPHGSFILDHVFSLLLLILLIQAIRGFGWSKRLPTKAVQARRLGILLVIIAFIGRYILPIVIVGVLWGILARMGHGGF